MNLWKTELVLDLVEGKSGNSETGLSLVGATGG